MQSRTHEAGAAEIIRGYMKPIFGFALNRTNQRPEAEDLAQEILVQLFKAFASAQAIHNTDAYVWTIAKYTWAKWLKKRSHTPQPVEVQGLSELLIDAERAPIEQMLRTEAFHALRREIAFLSELHRRIVVLHYYEGLKQSDIAGLLGMPVNTVKWHLHDARKELRRGMDNNSRPGQLSFNPVRLAPMGHAGSPGARGETNDFLGRSLAQNIVYAVYRKPLTVRQIAEELGVPPFLLEDEVRHLAEYNYLTETTGGKFISNTIIWMRSAEELDAIHRLYEQCAAEVADAQFDALMDAREQIANCGLYCPDGDFNFLLWTLLPKTVEEQSYRCLPEEEGAGFEHVAPLRKDGGQYIAYADLVTSVPLELSYNPGEYGYCGTMNRSQDGNSLYLWQLNTYWSDREDWRYLHFADVEQCHAFWSGALAEEEQHREQYAFLIRKGYIRQTAEGWQFNAIWIDSPATLARLNSLLPDLSAVYTPAIARLYESVLAINLRNQPQHLHRQIAYMVKVNCGGGDLTIRVLRHLLDSGKLQPPLPHQRKTITTWMGPVRQQE